MTLRRVVCLMLCACACGSPAMTPDASVRADLAVADFSYNVCAYTCPSGQFEFEGVAVPLYDASSPPVAGCNPVPGGCNDCACLLSMFGSAICSCNACSGDRLQLSCTNGPV
jgi:hypothetical protein